MHVRYPNPKYPLPSHRYPLKTSWFWLMQNLLLPVGQLAVLAGFQVVAGSAILQQFVGMAEMGEMVRHFMNQVKMEDMINVGFMKPVELALRTRATDPEVPADALPQGMLIAVKEQSINDNKYKLEKLTEVNRDSSLQELRKNHQDNYVSLLKKPQGLELAICVCMYSEDKPMLKRTLTGIADNIDRLIEAGMSPDDIFVCIVIDGIMKVDESLFDYFEEFERESEIFLQQDDELSMRQKYNNLQVNTEVDEEEPLNYSKFLFEEKEYHNRIERKFTNVRDKYDNVVRIRTQIQNIKKERNSSNQNLKMILNKIIDQQKNALRTISEDLPEEDMQITEESIMKELGNSEEECNQYISSRDSLAYVSAYRLPTRSLSTTVAEKQAKEEQSRRKSAGDDQRDIRQNLLPSRGSEGSTPRPQDEQQPAKRNHKYVNLFFCIKYKNSGKLSSHNWFFNGFCNELKPKYAILLDVGLRPYPEAVFKMYNYMKANPKVGGVCGYMSLKAEKVEDEEMHKDEDLDWLSSIIVNIFDIQRAQQIEYHFAHLIDKPFESIFKFIHVLPGAFSGYSMDALRPVDRRDALLREYFKSIDEKLASNKVVPSNFTASDILMRIFLPKAIWKLIKDVDPDSEEQVLYNENIYLAEDRILCMGIHKNERDIIFMPDAYAEVDPIKTVNGLMGQRKRWINGSQFAFEKVQKEMKNTTSPSMAVVDFFLKMQIFYLNLSNFLVYFAPALMLFTFHLTMQTVREDYLIDVFAIENATGLGSIIYGTFVNITDFIYVLIFLAIIFFSIHLTHTNKKYIYFIYFFSTIFGLFSLATFVIFFIDVIKGFAGLDTYLRQQYETKLNNALPGVGGLIDLLRYFIITSMGLYILPIGLYGLFFLRIKYLWEIITGTLSFMFYSPSYLNLLNIYALCRIDDISWGTKGLDESVGGKNSKLKQTWKIVKMIDVAKFLFWNLVIGVILIIFDGYLIIKFFITLSLLCIFTFIQAIKMIIGLVYLIKYKCIISRKQEPLPASERPEMKMHIYGVVDALHETIRQDIQYSFVMASSENDLTGSRQSQHPIAAAPIAPSMKVPDRVSKANVAFAFQANKFQDMRKKNEGRKSFYPQNMGPRKSRMAKNPKQTDDDTLNIEVHLLQRKVEQQAKKQGENIDSRQMSRNFQKIRSTFLNNIQSRRVQ